ncbi:MAG: hypothetical protein K0R77_2967 [Chryseobacterium sp.]|jgi:uncharacterized membrane protein YadS|nr:hypothetical protein [Chryseobacterium sp.]
MKEIYSNKIFNWILIVISIITLIDTSYLLTTDFEYCNVLTLRIILFIIPALSLLSFFVIKLNKEFYSRLFILANLIAPIISIYYRFLVDLLFYSVTRTDVISNPAIHVKLLIGIILFHFSIKFSKNSEKQRENEYGIMTMIYGIFLIILSCSKLFHTDSFNFSVIEFIIKVLLCFGVVLIGNKLRLEKITFKKYLILTLILTVVITFF